MATVKPPPPIPDADLAKLPQGVQQWLISLDMYLRETVLTHNQVQSTKAVGGAGSAGAGNQYVEIQVHGTKYKVLHDGTL